MKFLMIFKRKEILTYTIFGGLASLGLWWMVNVWLAGREYDARIAQIQEKTCKEKPNNSNYSSRSFDEIFDSGDKLFDQGSFSDALIEYCRALSMNSKSAKILTNIGAIRALDNPAEGLSILDLAETLQKDDLTSFNRGIILAKMGQFEQSLQAYTNAVNLGNRTPRCLFERGLSFSGLGRWQEAETDFTEALRQDSKNPRYMLFLAIAKGNINDYPAALELLEKAILIQPENAQNYYMKAIALGALGRAKSEVLHSLDKALSIDPQYQAALLLKAKVKHP